MIEREVAELRARVARLERVVEVLSKHIGITVPDLATPGASAEVVRLVRSGDKISAIKLHMQQTGCDIGQAKKLVDSIE